MADPFSVAAGIAGLLSLGIQITESLVKFYTSYKDQDAAVAQMTQNLENLLGIFRSLDAALRSRQFRADEQDLIKNIEGSIKKCDEIIKELRDECEKLDKVSVSGIKGTIKVAGRRTAYPFRQSTLQKLEEDIGEIRDNLSLALDVLQLGDHRKTQDDITELKLLLERMRASQISSTIRDWLKAPDATINHNAICAKRHPGTGLWFVKGHQFTTWLTQDSSFLWLHGFAGCGKSVLSSTAVQHTFRQKRHEPDVGIAFFYFTFTDESKQDALAMIRALLLQLSGQLRDGHADLARLHASYQSGTPPPEVLIEYLRHMIQKFHHVYILLDALDESPRYNQREDVLDALEKMRKWSFPGLHLLVTSRDEPDIRQSLSPAPDQGVIMKNAEIDKDISSFISTRLSIDPRLQRWKAHHDRIQEALGKGAQGVFRWVECQFVALKQCPGSERRLNECLHSLPRNLDETYERMLCGINESSVEEARRILVLLAFSARPLTVEELIDGIAVNLDEPAHLDYKSRLQSADDLHEICPGLIDIVPIDIGLIKTGLDADNEKRGEDRMTPTIRIAHFSVQEYLESDRIRQQKAAIFALQSGLAHSLIAQVCLVYLLEPELSSGELDITRLEAFPLARFAARFWHHHYTNAKSRAPQVEELVLKLFKERKDSFHTWIRLYDIDSRFSDRVRFQLASSDIPSPVYYTSLLGLDQVLRELIAAESGNGREIKNLINAQGGYCGNALKAASINDHEKMVQMLLNNGADINAQDERHGYALEAASREGHEKIVRVLLSRGADVNAQSEMFGNALYSASAQGHEKIVQMLLDKNADVNAHESSENPFRGASREGHEKIVQMLLNKDSDVNSHESYDNAIHLASFRNHEKRVQMMLSKNADVNPHGSYGTALQAASAEGHEKIVQMLLNKNADVNAQDGLYGTALQAASYGGHEKIVQMLLNKNANVNARGGRFFDNALQAASYEGHEKIVQMLLKKNADVNAREYYGYHDTALQGASAKGHEKIVQMLLDKDADVNARGGRLFDNALAAASAQGREKIVQMLLDKNADVNDNSLQEASYEGHEKIVQMLLNKNADVNAHGRYGSYGSYGTALQAASAKGREKIVQMLLNKNADVNAHGRYGRYESYGTALQAASAKGHEKIVQMLLNKRADVNAPGGS
ncbi:hypothetical protein FQN54_008109 [Arachnomyces sp. PD_36]|nr:hypothetical protein FQN54_008109 [Arachnomyces sp. PD_36]